MGEVIKKCKECGEVKPLSHFDAQRERPDGHRSVCKTCTRKRYHVVTVADAVKSRAKYQRKQPKASPKRARAWQARNPEKNAAQQKVRNAVRDGKLVKPTKCDNCERETVLHGHHPDYSKPLTVDWLCPRCHKAVHREMERVAEIARLTKEVNDLRAALDAS